MASTLGIDKKALQDMEGFLQLNTYRGAYDENRDFLDGKNTPSLIKLFTIAYNKYLQQLQNQQPSQE
jgi:hypothetical protein